MANTPTKVFLDANILIEICHRRDRFDDAVAYVRQHAGHTAVSVLTAHLVMYFGRKVAGDDALKALLSDHDILPITSSNVSWAFNNEQGDDFEDALQVACAIDGNCTEFATFDSALAKRYAHLSEIKVTLL